jgi:hypothetical protein
MGLDGIQWWAILNTVMKLKVLLKAGKYFD